MGFIAWHCGGLLDATSLPLQPGLLASVGLAGVAWRELWMPGHWWGLVAYQSAALGWGGAAVSPLNGICYPERSVVGW